MLLRPPSGVCRRAPSQQNVQGGRWGAVVRQGRRPFAAGRHAVQRAPLDLARVRRVLLPPPPAWFCFVGGGAESERARTNVSQGPRQWLGVGMIGCKIHFQPHKPSSCNLRPVKYRDLKRAAPAPGWACCRGSGRGSACRSGERRRTRRAGGFRTPDAWAVEGRGARRSAARSTLHVGAIFATPN